MGRVAKFDRDKAIEKVMYELWQKGYEACSVKSLSETLEITRSSFYHAFGSREALFKEALTKYFEQSPAKAFNEGNKQTPIKALFTDTFKHICSVVASANSLKGCMLVNCTSELANIHPDLSPYISDANKSIMAQFEYLVNCGKERKEITEHANTKALALILQNLLNGIYMMSKVPGNEDNLWLMAEQTLKSVDLYEG
ncbi:TetR/AcrR family transcriptional regulator [Agaribacter marinus]|uniref:TetR family transcriptional regulator n=1 Tax=Agaribacter marinus TaxID=1431249 RepID=A0AA37WH97_9ALTE|nr:TetR/AcrR family transcriptional regulator [Agaribacter marinus]GLR69798.1 TetR family transcriptional regulator [Agaribacter marinus]